MGILLDIAEVAERSGIPASSLRYYEKIGLISSTARKGLRRQFLPGVVQEVALIRLAKAAGFQLDEIGEVLNRGTRSVLPRDRLVEKAVELDKLAERLGVLARLLRHVAECPEPDHFACDRFQKLLKVAARVAD